MPQNELQFKALTSFSNSSIFFNLKRAPVCYWLPENFTNSFSSWIDQWKHYYKPIEPAYLIQNKYAIINAQTMEGISIVDESFTAIRHEDAMKIGMEIFANTFGKSPEIHRISSSQNGTEFSVDLIHPSCKFTLSSKGVISSFSDDRVGYDSPELRDLSRERPIARGRQMFNVDIYDEYYPFIRVSNFLKRGRCFTIEMGYYRYKCSNGMLMGLRTKYTFKRNYSNTSLLNLQEEAFHYFRNIRPQLIKPLETMWNLLRTPLSFDQLHLPAVQMFYDDLRRESFNRRRNAVEFMMHLRTKYAEEIGLNYNAAMNIATDLSHFLYGETMNLNRSQSMTGAWLSYFKSKRFNPETFVHDASVNLEKLMKEESESSFLIVDESSFDEDPIF